MSATSARHSRVTVIDDRQDAEAAAIGQLHRTRSPGSSAGSGASGSRHRAPGAQRPLAAAASAHRAAAPRGRAGCTCLLVDDDALAPQQHMQATIAEPAALGAKLVQPRAQRRVIRPHAAIANRMSGRSRSPGTPAVRSSRRPDADASASRLRRASPFFSQRDPSAWRCRASPRPTASSARLFSSSSAFSRFASDTSRPPYLAFHL